ncbi:MAG TPA: hypothetical protein VIQ30_25205 [Pseudonocardia sp.]
MTNTATAARKVFLVLGSTDEVTSCEHCGRTELKGTIRLGVLDADGNVEDVTYFGAVCGARAAGWTTKDIRKRATAADRAAREAARIERDRLDTIEHARIRALDGTAECYKMPTICRKTLKGACVAHPA